MQSLDDLIASGNALSTPFWTALAEGRLDVPVCHTCARLFFFPRPFCPYCWSTDTGWKTASGRGTVYSFSVARVPFQGLMKEELPFAAGLVDLEEGVRLPARFSADCLPRVGQAVQCSFSGGLRAMPVFLPIGETAS